MQMEKARKLDIDESIYYEIIRNKTASLISAACETGAASASTDENLIAQIRQMGEYIGMAFQIKDDLFDFGEKEIGKPRGIDIKERKMTLPLIYALNHADKDTKKWIINTIKNHNEDKVRVNELIQYVIKSGGIEYTQQKMYEYKEKAFSILNTMPTNEAHNSLRELVDYITERNY
jgi:octaprenyl-diphosphate synthase